jgi:hypothetical protein
MESETREAEMITKTEKLEIIAEETAKIRRRFFANSKVSIKRAAPGSKLLVCQTEQLSRLVIMRLIGGTSRSMPS